MTPSHKMIMDKSAAHLQVSEGNEPRRTMLGFLFPLLFAFAYAAFLASLPVDVFLDRHNYIIYTAVSDIVLHRYQLDGWATVLTNEPLWLLLNISLSRILSPDNVLRVFIFLPAFVVSYVLLRRYPRDYMWVILFLIFPLFLKNYIIHLRQGVAISIFILGYYHRSRNIGLAAMVASAFIHSSFFFILSILLMSHYSGKLRMPVGLRLPLFIILFIILAFALSAVSSSLGARQATDYIDMDIEVSGFAFLFWSLVLAVFVSSGKGFITRNVFPVSILAFYLSTYFLIVVSGRIFESGIIVVLLAGLSLEGARKNVFLLFIAALTLVNYMIRFSQPWLGWGVL